MFSIYILKSLKNGRYYVGQTENMGERIKKHNSGQVKSTKPFLPWQIVYSEQCPTRSDARKRENEIKKYKGGIKFKRLLGLWKE